MCGIITGIHKVAIIETVMIAERVSLLTESRCRTVDRPFCIRLSVLHNQHYKNNTLQLMEIDKNKLTFAVLAAVIASMTFAANGGIKPTFAQVAGITPPPSSSTDQAASGNATSGTMSSASGGATNKTTVTRDTVTILLEGKSIPAKGFLHLYDSTPYKIMNGHIALHIPCDSNSKPIVDTLIGSAPDLKPMEPELIKELSQPGNLCIFHVDVGSDTAKNVTQTDIAIQNPSTQTITFPASSGISIGINEIMPMEEEGHTHAG